MSKENLFNWCDFYNFADTFSDSTTLQSLEVQLAGCIMRYFASLGII